MNNCKVFTPQNIANQMLDSVYYKKNLYGKKVLESACGEGDLLICIAERYIIDCLEHNIDKYAIKRGLENDICGYDIDKACCDRCNRKLNELSSRYGIEDVQWNIKVEDSLRFCPLQRFDFVIGNPPYITYRDLDKENRNDLRQMYLSCNKGAFDYCYAFLEHDLSCLEANGKLVYLIPSSIFKNVHAKSLRELIRPYVTKIIDFTTQKLFGTVLTSSAILVCENNNDKNSFYYLNFATDKVDKIATESLTTGKWIFQSNEARQEGIHKFSDYFTASIVIATLLNEAFVLRNAVEDAHGFLINGTYVEKEVICPSASPRTLRFNKKVYIIFPYYYENELRRYSETEFQNNFPGAVEHLRKYYDKLLLRDVDKSTKWYEYGRSQALSTIRQKKLLLSTVITNKLEVYSLAADTIPYSGIYICSKDNILSLDIAKKILQSEDFLQYVQNIGIHANGKSIRITCKDIENYKFNWPEESSYGET